MGAKERGRESQWQPPSELLLFLKEKGGELKEKAPWTPPAMHVPHLLLHCGETKFCKTFRKIHLETLERAASR